MDHIQTGLCIIGGLVVGALFLVALWVFAVAVIRTGIDVKTAFLNAKDDPETGWPTWAIFPFWIIFRLVKQVQNVCERTESRIIRIETDEDRAMWKAAHEESLAR